MIHEGQRLPFTRKALFQLILYFITNKNTKEYDKSRAHFIGEMFPKIPDLGIYLESYGDDVSKEVLHKRVKKYSDKVFKKVVDEYVLKSDNKKWILDENQECHTINENGKPELFFYYGSLNPTDEELDTLRSILRKKHKGKDEKFIDKKVNKELLKMTKYFQTQFFGGLDIDDIKGLYNYHLGGSHDHIHYIVPAFNPKTGLFFNPKSYAYAKQQAHIKTELKFKSWLTQGIAQGLTPEMIELRDNSIEKIIKSISSDEPDYIKRQTAQKLYDSKVKQIEKHIKELSKKAGLSFDDYVSEMEKRGVKVELGITKIKESATYKAKKSVEKFLTFTDIETGATTTNPFLSKEALKVVQRMANRHLNDRRLAELYGNKWKQYSYDRMEVVLLDTLNASVSKMNRKLAQDHLQILDTDSKSIKEVKEAEIQKIKLEAFDEFFNVSMKKGIIVNMNKQKHLTYHKIVTSWKDHVEFQTENYKSSNFVLDLQGKTIAEIMSLSPEILAAHQETIMQFLGTGYQNHCSAWLKNGSIKSNQFNELDQEYFQSEYYKKVLEDNNWRIEQNEQNNTSWIVDNATGEGLLCYLKKDDGSFTVLTNELKPWKAAEAIMIIEAERVKELVVDEFTTYYSNQRGGKNVSKSPALQALYVKKLFSKDNIIRDKLNVFAWGSMIEDSVQSNLTKELERADKAFLRGLDKASERGSFNFTDASHALRFLQLEETKGSLDYSHDEELFRDNERKLLTDIKSQVSDQVSKQIAIMVDCDIKTFTFNKQNMDHFLLENRETIVKYVNNKDKLKNIYKLGSNADIEVVHHINKKSSKTKKRK